MKKLIAVLLVLTCLFCVTCGCGEETDGKSSSGKGKETKAWLPCGIKLEMTLDELAKDCKSLTKVEECLREDTTNNGYKSFDMIPNEELKAFYSVKSDFESSYVSLYFDKNKRLYSVQFTLYFKTEGELEDVLNNIVKCYQDLTDTKPTENEWSTPNVVGVNYEWNTDEIKIQIDSYASNRGVYNFGVEITHPKYKEPEIIV